MGFLLFDNFKPQKCFSIYWLKGQKWSPTTHLVPFKKEQSVLSLSRASIRDPRYFKHNSPKRNIFLKKLNKRIYIMETLWKVRKSVIDLRWILIGYSFCWRCFGDKNFSSASVKIRVHRTANVLFLIVRTKHSERQIENFSHIDERPKNRTGRTVRTVGLVDPDEKTYWWKI